jgi:hypothetical protein
VILEPGEHELSFPEQVIAEADLAFPAAVERAKQIQQKTMRISTSADGAVFVKGAAELGWNAAAIAFEERGPENAISEIREARRTPMP